MKSITTFLIVLLASCLSMYAQGQTVTIEAENVTVKELLKMIENRSSYTFAYLDSDIDSDRKVSVSAKDRSIISIISEVLPQMAVEVKGNSIILSVKKQAARSTAKRRLVIGHVSDQNGEPVIGAMVILSGTTKGTATDQHGNYSLEINQNDAVLEFSSIGYEAKRVRLSDSQTTADIIMPTEVINLEEAVMIGYDVQNKRDITTAISSIKAEVFQKSLSTDFRDAMAAKMPGVQVLSLSGSPEGDVSVRIRGIQSATAGNDPLYVIDGIPSDSRAFSNLESSDIESLEVLKDASAAAIYGSRGSCGVILITTKGGSSDHPVINYNGSFSVSGVSKKIDMLNAYEWASIFKEARDATYLVDKPTGSITDPYDERPNAYNRVNPIVLSYLKDQTGTLTDTDWQDAIFRPAISHKHSVSVSAKTKNLSYYIGANYLYREGIIVGSDFQRVGVRMNLEGKRKRLSYGVRFSPTYSKTNHVSADTQYGSDGVVASALMCVPLFPVYNEDGSYNWDMNGYLSRKPWSTQVTDVLNPVALATEIDDIRQKVNLSGNAWLKINFIKGLDYRLTIGGDYYSYVRNYYRPSYIPLNGKEYWIEGSYTPSTPTAKKQSNSNYHWNITNQLSYKKKLKGHSINLLAVYEAEKESTQTSVIVGKGTQGDDKIRTTKGKTIIIDDTYDNMYAYTFASWLFRAQYSYKGKYLVSASIRGDGSSRFAPDTRWGYFPAVSVGWRMSDERFMRNADWISSLKLRASVGQTGNAQIGNNEYLALYGSTTTDLGSGILNSMYPSQIANNGLGWEKNTQYNAGVDADLWNGLLNLTADFYYTRTTDMLFDVPVPSLSGITSTAMNIGSMENKGVELMASSRRQFGDFYYELTANWTMNKNKVLSLGHKNEPIIKEASYEGAYYITKVGHPVGSYFLLVQDGVFHNQKEIDNYPHFDTARPGDFKFIDADGDGVMEKDDDRVIVGNYMPDFYYGFGFELGYKGWSLSANFQGVYGNEILNLERRYLCNITASSNMMRESLQRWPYGEANRATRKTTGNSGACTSTFHLEDGSYLRLQNLSLGYTFPNRWLKKVKIRDLRLFLQGSNIFTFTNYSGYNPEVNKRADDALRPGEDYCSYPLARTFSIGLNFNL